MDNLTPPILQPPLPTYPDLPQILRVVSPSIGGNIYPAITQQYNGSLAFRDREAAYVYEPNGVQLSPAYYDCRLVGSYLGLPLYATSCCVSIAFSSSGSPSDSSSGSPN